MSAGPPPRRESSTRSLVLTIGLGVVIAGAAVFAVLHFVGGSNDKPVDAKKVPVVAAGSGAKPASKGHKAATPSPSQFRPTTTVAVLNGTSEAGLAATTGDPLRQAGYGNKNVSAGNNTANRNVTTSVVMYKSGARAQGNDVAKILDIKDVRPIDAATANAGGGKDVVVIVGQDKFK